MTKSGHSYCHCRCQNTAAKTHFCLNESPRLTSKAAWHQDATRGHQCNNVIAVVWSQKQQKCFVLFLIVMIIIMNFANNEGQTKIGKIVKAEPQIIVWILKGVVGWHLKDWSNLISKESHFLFPLEAAKKLIMFSHLHSLPPSAGRWWGGENL